MQLIFAKSKWELGDASLGDYLKRTREDGFDAVDLYLPGQPESGREIGERVRDEGLQMIAHIGTEGANIDEHIESFRKNFAKALETQPLLINGHTGRDYFEFEDCLRLYRIACDMADEAGVKLVHETHRGRPIFAATVTRRYLEAEPRLRLNADFSHWFCVHESDLSTQPENVAAAIERSHHIHARVGFEEGPQIPDPSAPEWQPTVRKFFALWQRIIDARKADGTEFVPVTPEFGPPPYMPCEPHTNRPLADAWEVNAAFLKVLKQELRV